MESSDRTAPAAPPDGLGATLGIEIVQATALEVVLRMPVDARHKQPMGIVHGGVYCTLVEAACSIGGYFAAYTHGLLAVGTDNQTSFLRAVRDGVLTTRAQPLASGRRTALWEARIEDDRGRLVATGRLRLLMLEPGSPLAGEGAGVHALDDHSSSS